METCFILVRKAVERTFAIKITLPLLYFFGQRNIKSLSSFLRGWDSVSHSVHTDERRNRHRKEPIQAVGSCITRTYCYSSLMSLILIVMFMLLDWNARVFPSEIPNSSSCQCFQNYFLRNLEKFKCTQQISSTVLHLLSLECDYFINNSQIFCNKWKYMLFKHHHRI